MIALLLLELLKKVHVKYNILY